MGAGFIGLVMVAIYVTAILAQGENSFFEVLPWALLMAMAALAAFASAGIDDGRAARVLVIGSAVAFTILGLVSILTIGFGFLLAALAAWVAAIRLSRQEHV